MPGARTPPTAATIARSAARPVNQATGCGATTAFTTIIVEIDHNTRPRVAGRGSAVFIHVARPGFAPTAGCVALRANELKRLLGRLTQKTRIEIHF